MRAGDSIYAKRRNQNISSTMCSRARNETYCEALESFLTSMEQNNVRSMQCTELLRNMLTMRRGEDQMVDESMVSDESSRKISDESAVPTNESWCSTHVSIEAKRRAMCSVHRKFERF
mmetsp:Transcript_4132/g.9060  ORF Transcript_4132/g.9060 Transcript_4132/m.9060 type:complete len:118 (-) Transcript_4132:35-388(-)